MLCVARSAGVLVCFVGIIRVPRKGDYIGWPHTRDRSARNRVTKEAGVIGEATFACTTKNLVHNGCGRGGCWAGRLLGGAVVGGAVLGGGRRAFGVSSTRAGRAPGRRIGGPQRGELRPGCPLCAPRAPSSIRLPRTPGARTPTPGVRHRSPAPSARTLLEWFRRCLRQPSRTASAR